MSLLLSIGIAWLVVGVVAGLLWWVFRRGVRDEREE